MAGFQKLDGSQETNFMVQRKVQTIDFNHHMTNFMVQRKVQTINFNHHTVLKLKPEGEPIYAQCIYFLPAEH